MAGQPTLWLDLDDLIAYLTRHSRPSGIQRVVFELSRALRQTDARHVGFLRRNGDAHSYVTVEWGVVEALFAAVTAPAASVPAARKVSRMPATSSRAEARAETVTDAVQAELRVVVRLARGLARLGRAMLRDRYTRWKSRKHARATSVELRGANGAPGRPLAEVARPGDVFLVLGSPWEREDYARTVRWVRDGLGMRFALMIYDLVPIRHPEWCHSGVVRSFTAWHRSVLPLADQVFADSLATAQDVEAYARETGISLPAPVLSVPMGTGFGTPSPAEPRAFPDFPAPESYVLFVSTLEARKNHVLLFRVWRRLLNELPRDQVPVLVFAGRVGWLVQDLMQQLENTAWLDGKIRLIQNPSDEALLALYRGCRFTLFPSLFEGWGLPVTESLALGRPCIVSNRTSLPEAGGTLARYFDPEDVGDATRVIREAIENRQATKDWQKQVAEEFRHVPWTEAASAIRAVFDRNVSG